MVGRLIEKQHVRVLEQKLCQFDAHAPATAEFRSRAVEVVALEAETQQCLLDILLKVSHVDGIELLAHRGNLLDQCHIVVALIVGACGKLIVHLVDLCLHCLEMSECLTSLLEHRAMVFGHEVLRQVADGAVLGCRDCASGGLPYAGKDLEQGRFASTILAHQCDAVFLVDYKRNVLKQSRSSKFDCQSVNTYHL